MIIKGTEAMIKSLNQTIADINFVKHFISVNLKKDKNDFQ